MTQSPFLTAEEAAAFVKSASVPAFRLWARERSVPVFHYGRQLRFREVDLLDAMATPKAPRGFHKGVRLQRRRSA